MRNASRCARILSNLRNRKTSDQIESTMMGMGIRPKAVMYSHTIAPHSPMRSAYAVPYATALNTVVRMKQVAELGVVPCPMGKPKRASGSSDAYTRMWVDFVGALVITESSEKRSLDLWAIPIRQC